MAKLRLIFSMLIFGTIGIFVEKIPLSSTLIACIRASVGVLFLGIILLVRRHKMHWGMIHKNLWFLLLSGAALGFNWIFLFEAYRYTTVSVATLCYYMAPVFVILLSPLVLKARLKKTSILCTCFAVAGAVLISGADVSSKQNMKGILWGLAAAFLYCSIILLNQFIQGLPAIETTFVQLFISAAVLIPYTAIRHEFKVIEMNPKIILLLLVVGIVHTGISYLLYFSSISFVPAQTAAVFSYIDPMTAILLSAWILHQPMTGIQILGTVFILGSTLFHELWQGKVKPVNQNN